MKRPRFRPSTASLVVSVALAVAASFIPDGINAILGLLGNSARLLTDPVFKALIALNTFLVVFAFTQATRLEAAHNASRAELETALKDAVRRSMEVLPREVLIAQVAPDKDTVAPLSSAFTQLASVIRRQQEALRIPAVGLLPLYLAQWEDALDSLTTGIQLSEDQFYFLMRSLVPRLSSLVFIDPTLYAGPHCFTTTFKNEFVPSIANRSRANPNANVRFIAPISEHVATQRQKSIDWMTRWYAERGIHFTIRTTDGMRSALVDRFSSECLLVFDRVLVIRQPAEEDWNKPREWRVTLQAASTAIQEYCSQLQDDSSTSLSMAGRKDSDIGDPAQQPAAPDAAPPRG